MAQSEMQPLHQAVLDTERDEARIYRKERQLRRTCSWLMLFFLFQGSLGVVWDREWHAYIGRDQFWTPPHTLMYSGVAGAGLIALTMVLSETFRYRRGSTVVNDTSTVSIFGFFHAPLGYAVIGFGALTTLIAAPLDNYWHELYGIDVAMWAPFHMMGIIGGLLGILGTAYLFASEAAIDRASDQPVRKFLGLSAMEWGAALVIASLMSFVLTGILLFPLVTVGTLQISTYPLPLVMGALFCFVSTTRLTRQPGVAMIVTTFLFINTLAVELFVPWAIRTGAAQQGLDYRTPGQIPHFSISYMCLPLALLISALVIDGFTYWSQRYARKHMQSLLNLTILGVLVTPPIALLAPFILLTYSPYAPVFLPSPGLTVPPTVLWSSVAVMSLAVLGMGAVGAWLGYEFGEIWRWNIR